MSEKVDITLSRDKGGNLVVTPDPFVLKKGVTEIRIRNDYGTDIQLNLKQTLVEELRIAARGIESITVERAGRLYSYTASPVASVRRREASPKPILEASPKVIVERLARPRRRTTRKSSSR